MAAEGIWSIAQHEGLHPNLKGAWHELIAFAGCDWCQVGRLCYKMATAAEKARFCLDHEGAQTPQQGQRREDRASGRNEMNPTGKGETTETPLERKVQTHALPLALP